MGFAGDFLIFGHRGAAGLAPENTLFGFRRAVALGVDAVEFDIHCVAGRLVVIHDESLSRTTNGRGKLADHTLGTLRRLDAGRGEHIPFLEEVLACLPPATGVNIELKGTGTGAALAACWPCGERDALVSSFDLAELASFQSRCPAARCAPLFHRHRDDMVAVAKAMGAWSINVADRLASEAFTAAARAAGMPALVYTVNEPARAKQLAAWGAKGVFTDFPDRVCADALGGRGSGESRRG